MHEGDGDEATERPGNEPVESGTSDDPADTAVSGAADADLDGFDADFVAVESALSALDGDDIDAAEAHVVGLADAPVAPPDPA